MKKILLMFLILTTVLSGCQSELPVAQTSAEQGISEGTIAEESGPVSDIPFGGLNYIDDVSNSAATLHWTHTNGAIAYQIFSIAGTTLTYVTSVMAPASSYTVTGIVPQTTMTYRVRLIDADRLVDGNTKLVTITTIALPNVPSGLRLSSPTTSPNIDETPTIMISGVKSGDSVKLFSDSSCTTQVGAAIPTGDEVEITTPPLALGSYTFYANSGGSGGTSACSTASVSYVKSSCPAGYVLVLANEDVGVANKFCVMQFEAKKDGDKAVSNATGVPWTGISQVDARAKCNALGSTYDLISNPEWMAIAHNLEKVASNWTDGTVGMGCLKRGNVGGVHVCAGGNSGYDGPDPDMGTARSDAGTAQMTLDSGEIIWDFSGNVYEWVDWTLGGSLTTDMAQSDKASESGAPSANWIEFNAIGNFTTHFPASALRPSNIIFSSIQGVGKYKAGITEGSGAAIRGGAWNSATDGGIFSLFLDVPSTLPDALIGFRCVLRVN